MPPPVDRVYTLARDVLDAIVAGYATAGADIPDRRLVTPGLPTFDCEGVYVQVERVSRHEGNVVVETPQPMLAAAGHALSAALIAVTVVRCLPTPKPNGDPPDAADEEAAAELILTDAQRVLNVLVAAERAKELPGCNSLAVVEWVPVQPSDLGGGTLRLLAGIGR